MNEQLPPEASPNEWNPLASIEPVQIPLEVSGGRASVLCRRWTGRERLAYEDALTERMMTTDQHGEETVRIGTLRLFAVTLTVVGAVGFPVVDGRQLLTGSREQREADLLSFDPDTFAEIKKHALAVQPLPSVSGDTEDDGGTDDEEDPSRTPQTEQEPPNEDA